MKKTYTIKDVPNPLAVLRRAGYSPFRDPQTGDDSFVLRITGEFYPRFHLYVEDVQDGISFNLHLDQKKSSYGGNHAHSGEYEGPAIEKEMHRIDGWVKASKHEHEHENEIDKPSSSPLEKKPVIKKESWWRKIFFGA